jgi:hypothetical protein
MEGKTSDVIHFLNRFASGFLDERITEYRPDSLIMVVVCVLPMVSAIPTAASP